MFMSSAVVLVNKTDVLPYFDFKMDAFTKTVTGMNPRAKVIPISAKTGAGLEAWFAWLEEELKQKKQG
jgi:hydrogenase nickel incorporation protein HypB